MKKRLLYFFLLTILLMGGCSEQEEPSTVLAAEEANEVPAYYKGYVANPQVTADALLQEEGQTIRDDKGELVVNEVTMDSQVHKIGPVEITIREAKNLHYKPAYSLVDFYHSYTHDTEFDLVKFFVEIKNTSGEPLHFAPVALLETSSGEKKLWEDDVYLEELNGEMAAGETKSGNLGFLVEEADFEFLTITTSDVFAEGTEKIADAKTVDIRFR
ncbi:hypothetical protein AC739_12200 [Planococcus glaciei]|uniref:hypothetical protein n=1 Tax=Planococcus glaciei TaxID=459472 RepID=UPI00069F88F4|nr:hypothetical protein [Planococcus glaciei]KOF10017.1 hypothetical protein AC739_12200 [Planococcus glaciei]